MYISFILLHKPNMPTKYKGSPRCSCASKVHSPPFFTLSGRRGEHENQHPSFSFFLLLAASREYSHPNRGMRTQHLYRNPTMAAMKCKFPSRVFSSNIQVVPHLFSPSRFPSKCMFSSPFFIACLGKWRKKRV